MVFCSFLRRPFVLATVLGCLLLSGNLLKASASESDFCELQQTTKPLTLSEVVFTGVKADSQDAKELFALLKQLLNASNNHNIEEILKHYGSQYYSGDNLNLGQVKSLIEETWATYPSICYASKQVTIRVYGDWASIDSLDLSQAGAKAEKNMLDAPGMMKSVALNSLYLHRLGTGWEITGDKTYWEEAEIRYGLPDSIKVSLAAPEQVKAGSRYSVAVQANVPEASLSIASISNSVVDYPHAHVDEKFRPIENDGTSLQRMLTANAQNKNEMIVVTVGVTSLDQKNTERPSLALNGLITFVKRVNTIPMTPAEMLLSSASKANTHGTVQTSADGRIDTNKSTITPKETTPLDIEALPAPEKPDDKTAP
jgi:hypothetical protein